MRRLHMLTLLVALGVALAVGVVVSCSDDTVPAQLDGKVKEAGVADGPQTIKDLPSQQSDKFVWPDQAKDSPWPMADAYVDPSAPFGCQTSADCFGQQCCPTPWGVKLCAATCDLK